jgi:Swi5-dependent recombination DNA repair protein 1
MSTPAAKRRRIDAASNTLSKPFRSPFKTPFKSPLKTQLANSKQSSTTLSPQSTAVLSEKTPNLPSLLATSTITPGRVSRAKKTFSSPVATAVLNGDPDIAPLLRAQKELEKQLRDLNEELETTEQARKIERESKKQDHDGDIDGELVELIERWRGASRQAAEELFGKVRDRVNRYILTLNRREIRAD